MTRYFDKYILLYIVCFDDTTNCIYLNSECTPDYYGMNCRERCSGHCKSNKPCDHVSGECPGGCEDGYMDEFCNSCKKPTTIF